MRGERVVLARVVLARARPWFLAPASVGMRKSSKVAPGESQAHGEDELRSQKRIEELEREKAELLTTVDTQREEIARLREENERLRAASTLSSRVTGAGDGDKASSTPKPPTFASAPSAAAAQAASEVVVAEKATAENAASEKAASEKAAAEKAAAEKAAAEKAAAEKAASEKAVSEKAAAEKAAAEAAFEKSASGGCGNSKQVDPAKPEPGPIAVAETDEVEERRIVALLDSPNPDVLELRKLTPTQAAAAAEAAARQEARVEKLKAVPDAERKPKDSWALSGGGAIAQLMEKTPLIDLEWVIDLIELGGTVPRCQDVPNAAVLTASTVWRLAIGTEFRQLPVLVLSYPWLDFWHPDRLGAQLRGLLKVFKAYLNHLREDHGPHCTVGLMMDFLCLPQKPFTTDAERARFGESLHSINEWYFHPCTKVLVVSTPPPEGAKYTNTRLHEARGWCYFEKCAAMAVKHHSCLWDVAGLVDLPNDEDDFNAFKSIRDAMKAKREPPFEPRHHGRGPSERRRLLHTRLHRKCGRGARHRAVRARLCQGLFQPPDAMPRPRHPLLQGFQLG